MENKVICYYCGTIYDENRGKCPLCGSSLTASGDEPRPVQRRRITDEERRERQRAAKGKYSAPKKKKTKKLSPKPFQIAALVFLILTVLAVFYFIGDMIGWWPGLEDRIDRGNTSETDVNADACEMLELEPGTERIEFAAPGDTVELKATVNLNCGKSMYCVSSNERVAVVSDEAESEIGTDTKSAVFTVTATGYGEAKIEVTCGEQTASWTVFCVDPDAPVVPTDATEPEEFVPQLNYSSDASLFARGEKLALRVTNLPSGMKVSWTSDDVTVAKVNENGVVTAISGGKTIVTAQVGGQSAQVLIRCTFGDYADDGAHLKYSDITLSLARSETLNLFLYDSDDERITNITYTIDNPNVCEVVDGVVTAKGYGTTNVTAHYNGKDYTCIIRVS